MTPALIAIAVFVLSLAGTYAPRALASHLGSRTLRAVRSRLHSDEGPHHPVGGASTAHR